MKSSGILPPPRHPDGWGTDHPVPATTVDDLPTDPPGSNSAREQLEILLHAIPDEVWLKDLEGRYLIVNERYAHGRGMTREGIVGRTDYDLFPREVADRYRARDMQVIREGRRMTFDDSRVGPNGARRWFEEVKTPLRDDAGRTVGTVGISRDITSHKEAVAHYKRLVETAPYGIFTTDIEGVLTEANRALGEILNVAPASLIGRHFLEVVDPEDRDHALGLFLQGVTGASGTRDLEIRARRADGQQRLLHVRATDIRIDGVVTGSQGAVRDITEERVRELYLRRAERLASVTTLIGGVAHELNNPLAAIKSFAQLLLLDERSEDDRDALETVLQEADRAAEIVAGLRQLARDSDRGLEARRERTDLNGLVRHALQIRRYALDAERIETVLDLSPDLPAVVVDPREMEQVILTLVLNAQQALARGSHPRRLTVRTRASDEQVTLKVIDSGPGIAPEHLGRIFDPFFTTKAPGEGIGLGLSLVHGIVTEHGGEIHAESRPGEGATFRVELPVAQRPERATGAGDGPAGTLHLLVVDDEEPIRYSVSRFLARRGHRVEVAGDGDEALRRIESANVRGVPFDVILSDLRMPGLGGEALLGRLREQGKGMDRRMIFMSGDPAQDLTDPDVPVLFKPFELERVARIIEEHAAGTGESD